ncbi:MAG: hypothetical protein HQL01_00565 [Nitrospirae bacterium]|nr:hypothetical protein [Nitrospirota bacterium]
MRKGLVVSLFFLYVVMIHVAASGFEVPRMSADELKAKLGTPDVIIIDVRSPAAYNADKMKIKGSVRENPMQIGKWSQKYPKDKEIIFFCT